MLRYLNPLAWFRWFGQFFTAWLLSIPWRDAPKAVPALVLLMVLLITGAIAFTEGSSWRSRRIATQYAKALEVDDFETAELILRRQIKAEPTDADLRFQLANLRSERGDHEQATSMMRELVTRTSHEGAARWLLEEQYDGRKWSELNEQEQQEFGALLELVHQKSPDLLSVKRLLAGYYIDTSRPAKAVPLLVQLSSESPMLGLQAAIIQRGLGEEDSAEKLAGKSLVALSSRLEEEPTNTALAFAVAQNQMFLRKYRQAVSTLFVSLNRAKNEQEKASIRQAMAGVFAAYVAHIEQSPNRTPTQRVEILSMLEQALQIAPNNPRVLMLVADQVLATTNDDSEQVQALQKALIKGSSPGISHFIQGTAALLDDNHEKAIIHLELASETLPNSGAIMNNLAVALLSRDDANLTEILELSQRAIDQTAQPTPHFFETRGQVYFRLGKYLTAIPDFERALSVPELARASHKMLAKCYQELGQSELAQQHQEAADAIDEPEIASTGPASAVSVSNQP